MKIGVASLEKAEPSDTVRHREGTLTELRNLTRQYLNDFPLIWRLSFNEEGGMHY